MKRPKEITLGPYTFKIRWLDRADELAGERFGDFQASDSVIRVSGRLEGPKLVEVFLHEILHAIWWYFDIHDGDQEERTVAATSEGLTLFFHQNPGVREWISHELEPSSTKENCVQDSN